MTPVEVWTFIYGDTDDKKNDLWYFLSSVTLQLYTDGEAHSQFTTLTVRALQAKQHSEIRMKKPKTFIHGHMNERGDDMRWANDSGSLNECWLVIGGGTTLGGGKNLPIPPSPSVCTVEERGNG